MHAPHGAVTLSLSLRFCTCYPCEQAAFVRSHSRVRHFGGVFTSPYKNTWATRCTTLRSMSQGLDGSRRSSLTDDYQFELRDQAQLRRRRRRRRSRRAAERRAEGTLGALNPRLSYPHQHHAHHSHESTLIHCADCAFACARLAPRPRLTGA